MSEVTPNSPRDSELFESSDTETTSTGTDPETSDTETSTTSSGNEVEDNLLYHILRLHLVSSKTGKNLAECIEELTHVVRKLVKE